MPIVNRVLQAQPIVGPGKRIEHQSLSGHRAYQHWVKAAQLYDRASRDPASARLGIASTGAGEPHILTIRVDQTQAAGLDDELQAAYYALQPGDILIVDLPNSTEKETFTSW